MLRVGFDGRGAAVPAARSVNRNWYGHDSVIESNLAP